MNILCIIPPYIPSYFNAGHHLPIFQVAAYLRHKTHHTVDTVDAAALNFHWKDVCDLLIKGYVSYARPIISVFVQQFILLIIRLIHIYQRKK
ncbi:MAG: hypothetical protein NQ127_03970 [Candidatus Cardinium sp.]|nr:hypothetical protein [Candidatus Cardinium sp.]